MAIYNAKKLTLVKGEDTYIIDPLQGNESVYLDIDVTIHKTDWSQTQPYTYVWSNQYVTANCAINILFKDGVRDGLVGDFHFSKTSSGSVTFTTDEPPVGDIPIIVRIIDSTTDGVFPVSADLVATDAITGETNVQGALEYLDTNKIDKNQGQANAGKALGINSQGIVEPVPFSMADMTGATSSTAGVRGLVPAPAAGDHLTYLRGDGTWDTPPGSKPVTIALDTVTNTSGSYTHTTTSQLAVASMKAIQIECSNPDAFNDSITITVSDGSITLSCDDVAGTSDVSVVVMKQLDPNEGDPPAVTSTEFDILANRITAMQSTIIGGLYPVGSIYMSLNSTMPSILTTGMTWEAITGDYVLKTTTTETGGTYNNAGNTGSHVLTVDEIPSHSHNFKYIDTMAQGNGTDGNYRIIRTGSYTSSQHDRAVTSTGGGLGHTHTAGMPQNVAIYMWKRTA